MFASSTKSGQQSIFGSNSNNPNSTGGLFGSNNTNQQAGSTGGGLFGNSNPTSSGSLFGQGSTTQGISSGGLFAKTDQTNAFNSPNISAPINIFNNSVSIPQKGDLAEKSKGPGLFGSNQSSINNNSNTNLFASQNNATVAQNQSSINPLGSKIQSQNNSLFSQANNSITPSPFKNNTNQQSQVTTPQPDSSLNTNTQIGKSDQTQSGSSPIFGGGSLFGSSNHNTSTNNNNSMSSSSSAPIFGGNLNQTATQNTSQNSNPNSTDGLFKNENTTTNKIGGPSLFNNSSTNAVEQTVQSGQTGQTQSPLTSSNLFDSNKMFSGNQRQKVAEPAQKTQIKLGNGSLFGNKNLTSVEKTPITPNQVLKPQQNQPITTSPQFQSLNTQNMVNSTINLTTTISPSNNEPISTTNPNTLFNSLNTSSIQQSSQPPAITKPTVLQQLQVQYNRASGRSIKQFMTSYKKDFQQIYDELSKNSNHLLEYKQKRIQNLEILKYFDELRPEIMQASTLTQYQLQQVQSKQLILEKNLNILLEQLNNQSVSYNINQQHPLAQNLIEYKQLEYDVSAIKTQYNQQCESYNQSNLNNYQSHQQFMLLYNCLQKIENEVNSMNLVLEINENFTKNYPKEADNFRYHQSDRK